jgi:monofunctional biosynthetic peptidoglycan transglycosylase
MVVQYFDKDTREKMFRKKWVPLSQISDELQLAVIASEDQLFLEHIGFDIQAIRKAIDHNQRTKNKKIKGASTISQQTAKNVFLWPGRSWFRKGLEVYFTTLIEFFWSKERILEVYLNVIEMGNGIYGAQAASKYYFKKDAKQLTRWESAFLAAILPNPSKYRNNPNNPSDYILERQFWIVDQMEHLRSGEYTKLIDHEPEIKKKSK